MALCVQVQVVRREPFAFIENGPKCLKQNPAKSASYQSRKTQKERFIVHKVAHKLAKNKVNNIGIENVIPISRKSASTVKHKFQVH
jgi:hypothetical protein